MTDVSGESEARSLRLADYVEFALKDHAFLRLGFRNAHWISDEFVRTNQPWPHQLADWKAKGVRTVLNLRGSADGGSQRIEREACAALDLKLVEFRISSKVAPSRAQTGIGPSRWAAARTAGVAGPSAATLVWPSR